MTDRTTPAPRTASESDPGRSSTRVPAGLASGLAALALSGLAALLLGPAARPNHITAPDALAVLAAEWSRGAPSSPGLSPVAHIGMATPARHVPVVGDEGFWLRRQDLAGTFAGPITVGDRITIAAPASATDTTRGVPPAALRDFEVVEIRPLIEAGGLAATLQSDAAPSAPSLQLAMVVCREVSINGSHDTPHVVRFLIERPATPKAPDQNPRSL